MIGRRPLQGKVQREDAAGRNMPLGEQSIQTKQVSYQITKI